MARVPGAWARFVEREEAPPQSGEGLSVRRPSETRLAFDARTMVLVLAVAFLPPLLFLAWVRSAERHGREPWHAVFRAFAWGAVGAALFSILGEWLLLWYYGSDLRRPEELDAVFELPERFFLVIVAAPIVEELAKAWGLRGARRQMEEVEDGLVYGAAIGFGFAATENLIYAVAALVQQGETAYWTTAILRTFSGTFLHASVTGLVGYGYAHAVVERRPFPGLLTLPFLVLAILIHAGFNAIANADAVWGFGVILGLSLTLIGILVHRIRHLDRAKRARVGGFFYP